MKVKHTRKRNMEPTIMRMGMVLFFLAVLLSTATRAVADPDPNFYIYLCFGQSNMEGGRTIEEQDRMGDPRFQVLADFDNPSRGWKKGQWYTAVPPLTRRTKGISLVDSFGRTMAASLPKQIRVGVVKVGVSGTKIELWDKDGFREYLATADSWKVEIADEYGGDPYGYLVELAKIAQQDGVIKGILLHQGESNAEDKDWPRKVKVVYDNLMKDLNLEPESVPLLAGEVVNADQGGEKASANKIIRKLPETLPNSYVISSEGLPCNADHLHFTAEGYRQFGKRYAEKLLPILGYKVNETKLPTTSTGNLVAQADPAWTEPFPPFKIAGNLYYVGSKGLANYLITTSQGHILINSDLEENVPLVRASVERLGFKFTDIKILLISHAHWDHNAASDTIKKLTGAKYMVMDADVSVVESGGKTDFQYGNVPASLYTPTKVDRVLHDGDEVNLGGTVLVAHLTPGHTKGCTTWTMKVKEADKTYNVVVIGSPNVNPGYRLVNNAAYPQIGADYEKMFRVLKSLPCDIFLGAHGNYFDLETKYMRLKEGAPAAFVDPEGYKKYVADKEQAFKTELAMQRTAPRRSQ
jgi:metallo-beta-lactamase class B